MNEADTCRTYVLPKLQAVGWEQEPHSIAEQRVLTDGRIVVSVTGSKAHREEKKRADYVLRYTLDFPVAVVEAKARYKTPSAGLQQAKELRPDPRPTLRLCDQWPGHRRVRLHDWGRAQASLIPFAD